MNFGIFSDFQTPITFSQANLNVWFSQFLKAFWVYHEKTSFPMLTTTRKFKKSVLKFKKIAENRKIKGSLKNSKCHKIWTERGIGLKFWGFVSFNDSYQWSKFEANWSISNPDLRWTWLDWPLHMERSYWQLLYPNISYKCLHLRRKTMHRSWVIMCVYMWYTQNRTFSMLTLKKNCAQTLTFLSFACDVYKKIVHIHILVPYIYIHVQSLIADLFILYKAKRCHCIEKWSLKWSQNENTFRKKRVSEEHFF